MFSDYFAVFFFFVVVVGGAGGGGGVCGDGDSIGDCCCSCGMMLMPVDGADVI